MRLWLRRLFYRALRLTPDRPSAGTREADWLRRSTVSTEADERARLREEEARDLERPYGAPPHKER